MKLSVRQQNELEYDGRVFELNLAFDDVLRVFDIWKEDVFSNADRLRLSLDVLIAAGDFSGMTLPALSGLLNEIFSGFISGGERGGAQSSEKHFDFIQDADYIFASFFMDYGIDLIEQQGKLPWYKFIALFGGLSERTKMREVMSIRTRKIPAPTKYNADEIRQLRELKQVYALEISAEERERQFERGLDMLAETLNARAKAGD